MARKGPLVQPVKTSLPTTRRLLRVTHAVKRRAIRSRLAAVAHSVARKARY